MGTKVQVTQIIGTAEIRIRAFERAQFFGYHREVTYIDGVLYGAISERVFRSDLPLFKAERGAVLAAFLMANEDDAYNAIFEALPVLADLVREGTAKKDAGDIVMTCGSVQEAAEWAAVLSGDLTE